MPDVRHSDLITYDPLTEVTRRERKVLLGVSMLGLALVKVPLVPTKFAAFGIEFSELERQNFATMYALVVLYFLAAFMVYALTDYVAWRRAAHIRQTAYSQLQAKDPPVFTGTRPPALVGESGQALRPDVPGPSPVYRGFASWRVAIVATAVRSVFEFVLPIVFAAYVLRALFDFAG